MVESSQLQIPSANQQLQVFFDEFAAGKETLRVLEAGCGSTSHLDLGPKASVIGIDISADQLAQNLHLKEKIVGDLETFPLQPDDFDVIVCWDVLEHLNRPEKALANFVRAIKPGGIIVIAVPNLTSIKGLVTKLTPYRAHVWFYRYVMKDKSAGTKQFRQFPTYLRSTLTPGRMRAFAADNGLAIPFLHIYEGPVQVELRRRRPLANLVFASAGMISKIGSFGQVNLNHSDYMIVLAKPTDWNAA